MRVVENAVSSLVLFLLLVGTQAFAEPGPTPNQVTPQGQSFDVATVPKGNAQVSPNIQSKPQLLSERTQDPVPTILNKTFQVEESPNFTFPYKLGDGVFAKYFAPSPKQIAFPPSPGRCIEGTLAENSVPAEPRYVVALNIKEKNDPTSVLDVQRFLVISTGVFVPRVRSEYKVSKISDSLKDVTSDDLLPLCGDKYIASVEAGGRYEVVREFQINSDVKSEEILENIKGLETITITNLKPIDNAEKTLHELRLKDFQKQLELVNERLKKELSNKVKFVSSRLNTVGDPVMIQYVGQKKENFTSKLTAYATAFSNADKSHFKTLSVTLGSYPLPNTVARETTKNQLKGVLGKLNTAPSNSAPKVEENSGVKDVPNKKPEPKQEKAEENKESQYVE